MSLVFYYSPMSTASMVHWTLDELGVPYEGVRVNLQDQNDKVQKLSKVNPNLQVPVIVHDGVSIFESAAIQIYLGETFGVAKGLFPEAGPKRGEAMKWIVWVNVTLASALAYMQRNTSDRVPAELRNAKAGEQGKKDLAAALMIADGALQGRDYLLGDKISIVDFHAASYVHYVTFCGGDLTPCPNVAAWMKRCTERPIYTKLMQG